MNNILITGASGFIGRNLIEYLISNTDYRIISLSRKEHHYDNHDRITKITHDMRLPIDEKTINQIGEVDYIIHLAAATDAKESTVNPLKYVQDNIIGTLNLLEYARHNLKKIKKIIYFNTAEVFGPSSKNTVFFEDQSYNAINPYAATKIGAQEMCLAYQRLYNLPILITYTANSFGPGQNSTKFIPLIINKISANQVVDIHTDSSKRPIRRNYLDVEDICSATLFLMKKGPPGEKYNVVAAKNVDNLEIAQILAFFMKKELKHRLIYSEDSLLALPMLSGQKLRNLGWKQPKTLEKGLKELIKWKMKQ